MSALVLFDPATGCHHFFTVTRHLKGFMRGLRFELLSRHLRIVVAYVVSAHCLPTSGKRRCHCTPPSLFVRVLLVRPPGHPHADVLPALMRSARPPSLLLAYPTHRLSRERFITIDIPKNNRKSRPPVSKPASRPISSSPGRATATSRKWISF